MFDHHDQMEREIGLLVDNWHPDSLERVHISPSRLHMRRSG